LQNKINTDEYVKEIVKNLRLKQVVTQDELLNLCKERAEVIKAQLIKAGINNPKRLIIKENEFLNNKNSNFVTCRISAGTM